MPSPWQGKQRRCGCACFTHSSLCCAGGVCRCLGLWVNVVLGTPVCVLAAECRERAWHMLCCVPAPRVCTVLVAGGTQELLAGHPCELTCPLQRSVPRGMLSWWGRRGLHSLCLVPCWPFSMLGSASVESHHKVAAALVSPLPSWCTRERNGGISEEKT